MNTILVAKMGHASDSGGKKKGYASEKGLCKPFANVDAAAA